MRIIVLGAGVVGTAAAWYLHRDGHAVTVVDAADGPARETSFANAGHLAATSGPWADPSVPMKLVKWLGREDAPVLLRPRFDPELVRWGLKFLRNCTATRYAENAAPISALGLMSVGATAELRAELGIDDEFSDRGTLTLLGDRADLAEVPRRIEKMRAAGYDASEVGQADIAAIEPALAHVAGNYVGAILARGDAVGDAHKFTLALAARAQESGVQFRFGVRAEAIELHNGAARGLKLAGGERLDADAIVLAAGPWTAKLAAPLGVQLPIYPGRGYSVTIPVAGRNGAPSYCVVDERRKLYFTRFRDRVRVAGTLELNGFGPASEKRAAATLEHLRRMYPDGGDFSQATQWSALRPMTPDGRPLIGATAVPGLWVDSGHGPLGWTLAAGSGAMLAALVAGRAPPLEPGHFDPRRFA
jgi:D-amino-acid dehydrogenase